MKAPTWSMSTRSITALSPVKYSRAKEASSGCRCVIPSPPLHGAQARSPLLDEDDPAALRLDRERHRAQLRQGRADLRVVVRVRVEEQKASAPGTEQFAPDRPVASRPLVPVVDRRRGDPLR